MSGKAIQIRRNDQYLGSKWEKWTLVYPPQPDPSMDKILRNNDLPDTIKRKADLFEIMRMYILGRVPDWKGTAFKVLHMVGGRGVGIKVIWSGRVWRDGRAEITKSKKTGKMIDRLGEPPFELK